MKQLFTILSLLLILSFNSAYAQKIISHTTTLGKHADNSIELTEYTDGTKFYTVWLSRGKQDVIGSKLVTTNTEKISMTFDTKEKMIDCLRYLYNFDKGEGYYIDLENRSKNMALSTKDGFIFSSSTDIDTPIILRWHLGKLLNTIGVSVMKKGTKTIKTDDDMYKHEVPLF